MLYTSEHLLFFLQLPIHLQVTIGNSFGILDMLLFFLYVGMYVEIGEEDDEWYGVSNQCVMHPFGKVAINIKWVQGMNDGKTELQLHVSVCVGRENCQFVQGHTTI